MTDMNASDAFDLAEQELAEAFVRGELDPEEARAFETILLPRSEVRARVDLIRYLIAAGRKETRTSTRSQRFAVAAALLIGIAAGASFLLGPVRLDSSNGGAKAVDTPAAGAIQTLRLSEGVMRSARDASAPSLIAGREAILEFQVHPGDTFDHYRVNLRQGGRRLAEASFPRPPDLVLRVSVEAGLLSSIETLSVTIEGSTPQGWMKIEVFDVALIESRGTSRE